MTAAGSLTDPLTATLATDAGGICEYPEVMSAEPVMTAEELADALRHAPPPTDEATILRDGRRIDSRESAMAWLAELARERAGVDGGER